MLAARKFRRRNRAKSISGCRVRSSTRTKRTTHTTPATSGATVAGAVQPCGWPWDRPKIRPVIAAAKRPAPAQSMRRRGPDVGRAGTAVTVMRIVISASGTLTRNTSRHDTLVSRPPSTGPTAAKNAEAPARMPNA